MKSEIIENQLAAITNSQLVAGLAFQVWEVVYDKSGQVKELVKVMQLKGHKVRPLPNHTAESASPWQICFH